MEKNELPPPYTAQPEVGAKQLPPPVGASPTNYAVQPEVQAMITPQVMNAPINYGPEPLNCICNYCHTNITTSLRVEPTTKTHLIALLLCSGGCFCCSCLPYCMDECQNRNHYCPSCNAYLGNYNA